MKTFLTAEIAEALGCAEGEAPELVLRTADSLGLAYGSFQWPTEAGSLVEAPDWTPEPICGYGLHGALWGQGDGDLLNWDSDALWYVVAARSADIINLNGKVKFPRCWVLFVGDQKGATDYIRARGAREGVIGAIFEGGDWSSLTGGDYSTLSGGDYSTLSGGDHSTLKAGVYSSLRGGVSSVLEAGDKSNLVGGDESFLKGGYYSILKGGNDSTLEAGKNSRLTGGYKSILSGTGDSVLKGGNYSTLTGGDFSTLTGETGSFLKGGDHANLTGGHNSVFKAGKDSVFCGQYWDGKRNRKAIAYVGENGILPNFSYILNNKGEFVLIKD